MDKSPLYKEVYRDLKHKIEMKIWKPGDQLPPEHALSEEYKVSIITIKSALGLLVSEGFISRTAGKGTFVMKRHTDKQIGFIVNGLGISYGLTFIRILEALLAEKGYTLLIRFSNEDVEKEKELLSDFSSQHVDGIIIFPVQDRFHNPVLISMVLENAPVIIMDRALVHIDSLFVGSDNYGAAKQLTEKLLSFGHRHISIVSHRAQNNTTISMRRKGIEDTLFLAGQNDFTDNAIDFLSSGYVFTGENPDDPDVEEDIKKTMDFISAHPKVTGYFCLTFGCAEIVHRALQKMNKKVPVDASIVCFDVPDSLTLNAFYTHIKQDETALAKAAAAMLLSAINGHPIKQRQVEIPGFLIEGNSLEPIDSQEIP